MTKSNKQKLIKKLDELASKATRKRDKCCLMCGKTETLQAHHWIVTRAHSQKYRWDLRNLATLCYACHLYKIHSTASLRYLDLLRKSAIMNKIATEQEIEEIKNDYKLADFSMSDLEEIKKKLEKLLEE